MVLCAYSCLQVCVFNATATDKLEFTNQLHVSVARLVFEELSRDDEKMKTMREKNGTIKPIICPKVFWPPPSPARNRGKYHMSHTAHKWRISC